MKLQFFIIAGAVVYLAVTSLGGKSEQTADLGQVPDRTKWAINAYQSHLSENGYTEVTG